MSNPLFSGVEGIFIPVRDPELSAQWYAEKLGFKPLFKEAEAITMRIADGAGTVVCLGRAQNHQPMHFPPNDFDVSTYFNLKPIETQAAHRALKESGVQVSEMGGDEDFQFFSFFDLDGNRIGVCS